MDTELLRPKRRVYEPSPPPGSVIIKLSDSLLIWSGSGRNKLLEEGRCRMCLIGEPPRFLTRHHVVPQSWFKGKRFFCEDEIGRYVYPEFRLRDANANIIPLCMQCHTAVEAPFDDGARRMLRKVMGSGEVAFAAQLMGAGWVDLRYPPAGAPPTEAHKSKPHVVSVKKVKRAEPKVERIQDRELSLQEIFVEEAFYKALKRKKGVS